MSGGRDRGMDQGARRASFHEPSPGRRDGVMVPLPYSAWVENQSLERQDSFSPCPSPAHDLFQKTGRKASVHPSAERISHRSGIKGAFGRIG